MATTHKKIQTVTVGAGGASSIAFTSIPQTYTDLVIKICARSTRAGADDDIYISYNGSATSYAYRYFQGYVTSARASSGSSQYVGAMPASGATTNTFGNAEICIPNYTSSNYKSINSDSVTENNSATAYEALIMLMSNLWSNTSSITSITLTSGTGSNFAQYSTATLYGVFKENVSGAPSAPTSVTATDLVTTGAISVAFTPAGQTASLFTVTSTPGSIIGTGVASPVTVSGLTNGTGYTFTVTAANPLGTSAASSASNSATPTAYPKAGYTAGGETSSSATSIIEKISLPAETSSTLSATLSANTQESAAMSNSGVAGYITGISQSPSTTINKLVFSTAVVSTLGTTLATARKEHGAMANSGTAGYVLGGSTGGGTTAAIDKIAFSNDARTTLAATLTAVIYRNTGAMANSGTAGYTAGGNRTDTSSLTSYIDKITFSNDSKSTTSATLSSLNARNAAHANSGTAGYFLGGNNNFTTIDKITFSSDSVSAVSGGMSTPRQYHTAFANSGTAGYAAGGQNTSNARLSSIEKLAYSNDAVSSTSVTMASARSNPAGFADSGTL